MDQKSAGLKLSIFFCQRLDADQDVNRRALEKELGARIRFFPLPCSGRVESGHLLRALESGADMVYIITCPSGTCRFREGNSRAAKRVAYTRKLIEEVGLEGDRLELVRLTSGRTTNIDEVARELLSREALVGPSPVQIPGCDKK